MLLTPGDGVESGENHVGKEERLDDEASDLVGAEVAIDTGAVASSIPLDESFSPSSTLLSNSVSDLEISCTSLSSFLLPLFSPLFSTPASIYPDSFSLMFSPLLSYMSTQHGIVARLFCFSPILPHITLECYCCYVASFT